MVVIIPNKRQCRRSCGVATFCPIMVFVMVACFTTVLKMSAWSEDEEEWGGERAALFPRSISTLDHQKTLWRDRNGRLQSTRIAPRPAAGHGRHSAVRVDVKGLSGGSAAVGGKAAHKVEKRETAPSQADTKKTQQTKDLDSGEYRLMIFAYS